MLSSELLKKVKQIEITTRKFVDDTMSGQYRTHFRGQGVQFSEHRVYQPGDDIRHIDWKASARTREALVKKYDEERELTVMLLVDVSASESFGSKSRLKAEMLAELGGIIAYAATTSGDKVGALLFSDRLEKIIPPKKGRSHVYRLIHTLLTYQSTGKGTDLSFALDKVSLLMRHAGIIFLMSDFISPDFRRSLCRVGRKHDVVALHAQDPLESRFPSAGMFYVQDPESQQIRVVDSRSALFRSWLQREQQNLKQQLQETFNAAQVESLNVNTTEDYSDVLVRFFRARNRRA